MFLSHGIHFSHSQPLHKAPSSPLQVVVSLLTVHISLCTHKTSSMLLLLHEYLLRTNGTVLQIRRPNDQHLVSIFPIHFCPFPIRCAAAVAPQMPPGHLLMLSAVASGCISMFRRICGPGKCCGHVVMGVSGVVIHSHSESAINFIDDGWLAIPIILSAV